MTLTELKYIIAVARERHFGRAAESCFISQPSLSVAVRKLEEELDETYRLLRNGGKIEGIKEVISLEKAQKSLPAIFLPVKTKKANFQRTM